MSENQIVVYFDRPIALYSLEVAHFFCCGYNFPIDSACQTMLNYFCFDIQEKSK